MVPKSNYYAVVREQQNSIAKLKGILQGISIDYELNDHEIAALKNWMDHHDYLLLHDPFFSLSQLIHACLKDGVIDEQEREEILDWCIDFINDHISDTATHVMLELHGILEGIAMDDVITENELVDLRDWLVDHETCYKNLWPFCETWKKLENIFSDGEVTDAEKAEMLEYCKGFSEQFIEKPRPNELKLERYTSCNSPVVKSFTEICNREHLIIFQNKNFCFTGNTKIRPRKKIEEIVIQCSGKVKKKVSGLLNYLVIGAESQPAWIYSTYGRKIELAQELNRNKNSKIIILHEDDLLKQAELYIK